MVNIVDTIWWNTHTASEGYEKVVPAAAVARLCASLDMGACKVWLDGGVRMGVLKTTVKRGRRRRKKKTCSNDMRGRGVWAEGGSEGREGECSWQSARQPARL